METTSFKTVIFSIFLLCFVQAFGEQPSLFPSPLKKGDTIALVAPASFPKENNIAVANVVKTLMQKGYRVKVAPNLQTRYGYLAGTDYDRAKAFMDAWLDPSVKAVWCYRGGYGSTRILERIDFNVIKKNPKIFIGMSDITAMHAAINQETGLVTYLGPNVSDVFGEKGNRYNETELWNMISTDSTGYQYPKEGKLITIKRGKAKGKLTGGNLSLVASLTGTPWEIDTVGKILVLEEVEEEPFRIDRMLCQLRLAGLLDRPAGVLLCSWRGCHGKNPDRSLSLEHVLKEYFANASYPVLLGFPSGHITNQVTLPLNVMAELDASQHTLKLLESAVQ